MAKSFLNAVGSFWAARQPLRRFYRECWCSLMVIMLCFERLESNFLFCPMFRLGSLTSKCEI